MTDSYILDTDKCRGCGKKEECSCYKTKACGNKEGGITDVKSDTRILSEKKDG